MQIDGSILKSKHKTFCEKWVDHHLSAMEEKKMALGWRMTNMTKGKAGDTVNSGSARTAKI